MSARASILVQPTFDTDARADAACEPPAAVPDKSRVCVCVCFRRRWERHLIRWNSRSRIGPWLLRSTLPLHGKMGRALHNGPRLLAPIAPPPQLRRVCRSLGHRHRSLPRFPAGVSGVRGDGGGPRALSMSLADRKGRAGPRRRKRALAPSPLLAHAAPSAAGASTSAFVPSFVRAIGRGASCALTSARHITSRAARSDLPQRPGPSAAHLLGRRTQAPAAPSFAGGLGERALCRRPPATVGSASRPQPLAHACAVAITGLSQGCSAASGPVRAGCLNTNRKSGTRARARPARAPDSAQLSAARRRPPIGG